MGKRIISRARGKGGPAYKSPSHRFLSRPSYAFDEGEVVDIVHDPARDVPLAKIRTSDGREILMIAAEGVKVGNKVKIGGDVVNGNVLKLSQVPKGSYVFGIETCPGSGPKYCKSPGTKAIIVSHDPQKIILQMPSRAFKNFHPNCLATFGVPANGGLGDKLFVKAGQKHYAMHARNKLWPRTSANKMNAVDHPFGGRTKPGTPKSISRQAPPGAKVGSISSRRTGRRRG